MNQFTLDLNYILLLSNGLFTLFIGFLLGYYILNKKVEKDPFYVFSSLGFIVYGVEILQRWVIGEFEIAKSVIGIILIGIEISLFTIAFWSLSRKKILLIIIAPVFILGFFIIGLWFENLIPFEIAVLSLPLGFFPIIFLTLVHFSLINKLFDVFLLGWLLLFFTNFLLNSFGWISDVFAIFSKILILKGTVDLDFIVLKQNIKRKLKIKSPKSNKNDSKEGGITGIT